MTTSDLAEQLRELGPSWWGAAAAAAGAGAVLVPSHRLLAGAAAAAGILWLAMSGFRPGACAECGGAAAAASSSADTDGDPYAGATTGTSDPTAYAHLAPRDIGSRCVP